MFLKNLHFSWQFLKRNPLFFLINVVGLVIGITSALFIFIYVSFETSYDRFHDGYENIYRVLGIDNALGVSNNTVGIVMPPLGPAMEETIPEVAQTVRVRTQGESFITVGDRKFPVKNLVFTEDAFFEVFSFPLLQRRPGALLDKPASAVMTRAFAEKVFGAENPMGKLFRLNNQDVEVAGVMENVRPDSHMQLELLVALNFLSPEAEGAQQLQNFLTTWGTIAMVTYAKLHPGASEQVVDTKLKALLAERSVMKTFSATLQPLKDAHLGSNDVLFDDFNRNKGDESKIVMLSSVAVFLLLIAAFNFMNLSTARASLRAKEVGVRKSAGATRAQLVRQFLQESLLLVGIALVLGVVLLRILEPVVSLPVEGGFLAYLLDHPRAVLAAVAAAALVGLLAGAYPAFVLSSFSPMTMLKGRFAHSAQGLWLRRVLVVLQFALSIAIIIGMLVVAAQLAYMKSTNPGFERDGIVNLTLNDQVLQSRFGVLKERLLALPQVVSVGGSSNMPGDTFGRTGVRPFGADSDEFYIMSALNVDAQYLDTLSMKVAAGRGYSTEFGADATQSIILNESAVRALKWTTEDAVGKTIPMGPSQRTVVGVVQDFHFADMRHRVEPVLLFYRDGPTRILSVRIDKRAPREALDGMAAVWRDVNPEFPFAYTFFTAEYERLFRDDEQFSAILIQFTFIAIVIACLGLYGLSSFSADRKTKEIGIRKVLGAGAGSLLKVVLNEYAVLIAVANLLAWGVAWVVMSRWLAGFVYRTELPLSSFVLATAGTALLALATVGRDVLKVMRSRPVSSLRYE
ncbi:MAG TPA: ABC transporter permease [Gammaproteobacteria bacterium]|nr:ABC transporter permease [Gammaproteobacteria bacterium]